jgi:hypothetical protein
MGYGCFCAVVCCITVEVAEVEKHSRRDADNMGYLEK